MSRGSLRYGYKHHVECVLPGCCACATATRRTRVARDRRPWPPPRRGAAKPACPPPSLQVALGSRRPVARSASWPTTSRSSSSPPEFISGMAGDCPSARAGSVTYGRERPKPTGQWGSGPRTAHVLAAALRAAGSHLDRFRGGDPERQCAVRLRASSRDLDDHRHGRHRALRLHRRHLAAGGRLGAADASNERGQAWLQYSQPQVCLGEFVLGYPQRVRRSTPTGRCWIRGAIRKPATSTRRRPIRTTSTSDATAATWSCASCEQDVAGFWQLDRPTATDGDAGRARVAREPRWSDASATACRSSARADESIEGCGGSADLNALRPIAPIPHGLRCPLGAHVRRSQPAQRPIMPARATRTAWSRSSKRTLGFDADGARQHDLGSPRPACIDCCAAAANTAPARCRIRRRPSRATARRACTSSALNANIARQFEFVQNGLDRDRRPFRRPAANESRPAARHARGRPHRRHRVRRRLLAPAPKTAAEPSVVDRLAAVRHGARRRLLLPARPACAALSWRAPGVNDGLHELERRAAPCRPANTGSWLLERCSPTPRCACMQLERRIDPLVPSRLRRGLLRDPGRPRSSPGHDQSPAPVDDEARNSPRKARAARRGGARPIR